MIWQLNCMVLYKIFYWIPFRSYHVFYYLLAGCPQQFRQEFQLKSVEQFNYLNQVNIRPVNRIKNNVTFTFLERSY